MLPVPESLAALLSAFALAFTRPTFEHVQVLVTGTLLTAGRRTVAAALRTVGLGRERHFTTYHRVLNRAVWSPLHLSRIRLHLLVTALLAPDAPLVLLIDGPRERRWGPKLALKGRSHDAVRSQPGHVVTTQGIHWVCLSLLVPSPWGSREWALPILTVPTRSPALSQQLGKPHRTLPQYAQVLVRLVRRWYPTRALLLVGESAFAAARLGHTCREHGVRLVSRLLLNAQLYDPVPPPPKGKPGVKPQKGPRQPKRGDRLGDEAAVWQTEALPWYAGQSLTMDLTSGTALWHRDGEAPLPIR
jgi:DDE superfamily endonuclease